jgi:WD40 repeat protein
MDKKKKNDYQIIYDEYDLDNPERKRKPKPVIRGWFAPAAIVFAVAAIIGLGLLITQIPESRIVFPTSSPVLLVPFPTPTPLVITVPVLMTAAPPTPPPSPEATVISRWITDVDWLPAGSTLAVAIWDAGQATLQLRPITFRDSLYASPDEITSIPAGSDYITNVTLSPDGKLVAASGDTALRLWDITTGAERAALDGSGSPEFSPSGKLLAFATGGYGDNHTVRLLDTETATEIGTLLGMSRAWSVAFSPDGQTLAVSDWDRISLWHVNDFQAPWLIESVNPGWARDLAFSHDSRLLAVATNDRIAVFDLQSQGAPGYSLQSPLGDVWSLAFSPDGSRLAAAVGDHQSGMAQIWDVATGQPLAALQGHRHRVTGIAYSPDGRRLITSSHDGSLRLWDAQTGAELSTLQL